MSIRNSKFKTNPADYCTTEPKKNLALHPGQPQ